MSDFKSLEIYESVFCELAKHPTDEVKQTAINIWELISGDFDKEHIDYTPLIILDLCHYERNEKTGVEEPVFFMEMNDSCYEQRYTIIPTSPF